MSAHLDALAEARRATGPGRLAGLRDAAEALAESIRETSVKSVELVSIDRVLVETCTVIPDARLVAPFAVLTRRALSIVAHDGTRVLVDPSDAGHGTPYEERLAARHPVLARLFAGAASAPGWPRSDLVFSTALALRTIDRARTSLASTKWLAMGPELEAARAPSARDAARYGRAYPALDAAPPEGLLLAPGVIAVPTPGTTPGHASVVFSLRGKIHVFTHGAVAVDAWSPYESKIPGLREAVRLRNVEAVVRGDSSDPTLALESLSIERALADRDERAPAFFHIVPAMALTSALIALRLRPFSLEPFT